MTATINSSHSARGHRITGMGITLAIAATAALGIAGLAGIGSGTGTVATESANAVSYTETVAGDSVVLSNLGPRWDFTN